MQLLELLNRANSYYEDGALSEYFEPETGRPVDNPDGGDTLAKFIVLELKDTFDSDACDEQQIETAKIVLGSAADQLRHVVCNLNPNGSF